MAIYPRQIKPRRQRRQAGPLNRTDGHQPGHELVPFGLYLDRQDMSGGSPFGVKYLNGFHEVIIHDLN